MRTQINEFLSESVEARRGGVSEIADLSSDLGDVAVGCAGKDPGCGDVLLNCPSMSPRSS